MDFESISRIRAEWFSLAELVKEDILLIDKNRCSPRFNDKSLYNGFVVPFEGGANVSNKFRALKSDLFGCYKV